MKKGFLIIVSIFLCVFGIGYTQQISKQSIKYKPKDWISYPAMRYVTCIDQGDEYIYFGTNRGICRYQFYKEEWDTPFTRSNGMQNDIISIIFYDVITGNLWCLTDEGLSYRIPTTGEWFNIGYPVNIKQGINNIGSGEKFLWLMQGNSYYKGDRFGTLFSVSDNESAVQDKVDWSSDSAVDRLPLFFMDNQEFIFDPEGYIKRLDLRQYRITYAFRDNFRSIWIGTDGLGCGVGDIRIDRLKMLPFGLFHSDVQTMAWDGYTLWIGGHSGKKEGGITRWNQLENSWEYYEAIYLSELRSDDVNDILVDKDTSLVWFATDDGLACYQKSTDEWKVYDVFDNLWDDYITSLAQTDDILWIGTKAGINRMQTGIINKVQQKILGNRMIYRLNSDGKNLWAGTDKGKYFHNAENKKWEYIKGAANVLNVNIDAIDAYNDEVWFTGEGGVEMYDVKKKEWTGYPKYHYPIPDNINFILNFEDIVWIASEEGLVKFVKSENRWRWFTVEDGLLHNSIKWLIPDGEYIWLGSPAGITRFYWAAPYRVD